MPNLRALYLFYLPITEAGLKNVAQLKELLMLNLSSTEFDLTQAKHLSGTHEPS